MDDEGILSESQLHHEFWKFAERMLPVFQSDAWDGWKPVNAREIVETLEHLWEDLKKSPESEYISTGGLVVYREMDPFMKGIYGFKMEITANHFEYPFHATN